ncbi:MAG: exodeoxyribonuclease VII small subunit [Erysipelotrichaceae bacterium]|nr:exodeoxyribonuclease VII small subunit [Erysipelotrichaceae bacterium]
MKEMSFEEAMNRLDGIVNQLEKGDTPLKEALNLFEEGLELVSSCDQQLKEFDAKLQNVLLQHQKKEE